MARNLQKLLAFATVEQLQLEGNNCISVCVCGGGGGGPYCPIRGGVLEDVYHSVQLGNHDTKSKHKAQRYSPR